MTAVVFTNFSYAYRGTDKVLDNINLTIAKGSFTAVTGLSGAGKTTLCMAVCGIVPHYYGGSLAGEVRVAGKVTADCSPGELSASVGTVMEDYESQLVTMTVEEEMAFALENHGVDHRIIAERIEKTLAQVGLEGMATREVSSLSGGQKQRLAIASVLATEPDILVLDEPASALDPEGAEEIYALLGSINRELGKTVIVVEHELSRVLPHVDQIVVLEDGKVAVQGSINEVMSFITQHAELKSSVPALWQLKLGLENRLNIGFGDWREESAAVEEITAELKIRCKGGSRSA